MGQRGCNTATCLLGPPSHLEFLYTHARRGHCHFRPAFTAGPRSRQPQRALSPAGHPSPWADPPLLLTPKQRLPQPPSLNKQQKQTSPALDPKPLLKAICPMECGQTPLPQVPTWALGAPGISSALTARFRASGLQSPAFGSGPGTPAPLPLSARWLHSTPHIPNHTRAPLLPVTQTQ